MARLTKENIETVLRANEGFRTERSRTTRNSHSSNIYTITDGKLYRRSVGKGGYGVGRYDYTIECDLEDTRRFIRSEFNRPYSSLTDPF